MRRKLDCEMLFNKKRTEITLSVKSADGKKITAEEYIGVLEATIDALTDSGKESPIAKDKRGGYCN